MNKNYKNKCLKCLKFSSFLLLCKCGHDYCTKHILPEVHDCSNIQDFRELAYERNKETLLKNATVIQKQLEKIN